MENKYDKSDLNEIERQVYNACVKVADEEGEHETEGTMYSLYHELKQLTKYQVKGYVGDLVKKGYLEKIEDGYFDFNVIR